MQQIKKHLEAILIICDNVKPGDIGYHDHMDRLNYFLKIYSTDRKFMIRKEVRNSGTIVSARTKGARNGYLIWPIVKV